MAPSPGAPAESRLGESPAAAAPDDDPIGRCVRRNRAALGPELARALAALEDDALLEDACGLDLAVRARDPGRCAVVRLSDLRERCVFRASVAAARPDGCPAAPGLRGRDPVCVALAARDASLCGAAAYTERARCLALAAHDRRPCDALDPLLRPACVRDFDALAALIPPLPRTPARSPEAARNAWVTPVEDASVEEPVAWLLRGVFLDEGGALWIVDPAVGWPSAGAVDARTAAARGGGPVPPGELDRPRRPPRARHLLVALHRRGHPPRQRHPHPRAAPARGPGRRDGHPRRRQRRAHPPPHAALRYLRARRGAPRRRCGRASGTHRVTAATHLIDQPDDLRAAARDLAAAGSIAIDCESDGVHHWKSRLCVLQCALPDGEVFIFDALALPLGDALGEVLGSGGP
jgi:hypothetical protein